MLARATQLLGAKTALLIFLFLSFGFAVLVFACVYNDTTCIPSAYRS